MKQWISLKTATQPKNNSYGGGGGNNNNVSLSTKAPPNTKNQTIIIPIIVAILISTKIFLIQSLRTSLRVWQSPATTTAPTTTTNKTDKINQKKNPVIASEPANAAISWGRRTPKETATTSLHSFAVTDSDRKWGFYPPLQLITTNNKKPKSITTSCQKKCF
ncbi:MAG: hypothetical protein DRQ51_07480 [Gammaproteobacteria bacterium]|nr:MAG: hypothetical protein DRQ51_07480 [Gammaproteobacteria bacterium]